MNKKNNYNIGEKYGKLTLLSIARKTNKSISIWRCECDCGNIVEKQLTKNSKFSCGDCPIKIETYGRLTTTGNKKRKGDKRNKLYAECSCGCGNIVWVEYSNLKNGNSKSCGCYNIEQIKKRNKKKKGSGNKIHCYYCNKEVHRGPFLEKRAERNYCSSECQSKDRVGRFLKKDSPRYLHDRTKLKGTRDTVAIKEWGINLFIRDNFTCKICGSYGGKLQGHHIKAYSRFPELRFTASNGITLCKKCHTEFHDLYGRKRFTSDDFYEFLKEKGVTYDANITSI